MATTDSNGILQLEVSDPVVPLQTALNGIGASVSSAMDSTVRTFKVANATARNNLATQRTPSKSDPLRVWRQDTGVYEINDGTGWRSETPAELDPNIIRIDGADYQRTGVVAVPSYSLVGGSPLFYQSIVISMPFTPPTGWGFMAAPGKGSTVPSSMMQLNYGETGGMSIMVQSVRGDGLITSLTWTLIKI